MGNYLDLSPADIMLKIEDLELVNLLFLELDRA